MRLKKAFNLILVLLLVLSSCALSSCGRESSGTSEIADTENVYYVYYSNADANDIIYREYTGITASYTRYETISALFYQMFDAANDYEDYYSAKPDSVEILDSVIDEDGILTIDFSSGYNSLTNVQEIILRSAVVLTIIQVEGIEAIVFTVEGEPATNASGEEIGPMTADTFVSVLVTEDGMLAQEKDLVIYFTDKDGAVLVPVTIHFSSSSNNISMEEYILQNLIAGPSDEMSDVYATLSDTVEVLSVTTTDHICYVNFSSSFLEQAQTVSDEIMIYSIVNSLCRLTYVSSVQFLVEGESTVVLHSVMDLSQPLSRNRTLEQSVN